MLHLVKAYNGSYKTHCSMVNQSNQTAHDFCSFKADIKESLMEIKLQFHINNAKGGAVLSSAAKYYHSMW